MNKSKLILLVVFVVASVVFWNQYDVPQQAESAESNNTQENTSNAPPENLKVDTLSKIKSTTSISLGVRDSSGLSFTIGNGKYVGFHTEMAERIVNDLKKQLKLKKPINIQYTPVTSATRISLVQNGTVDLECGSTSNTLARQKEVDFAITTYVEEVRMLVRENSKINSLQDLRAKTISTTTGTTSVQILRKKGRKLGVNFFSIRGKDHADSFLLLESGRADAFVMDSSILATSLAKAKSAQKYKMLDEVLSLQPIACALRKGDNAFKQAVNNSIRKQILDGSLEKLYNKWFMQPIPPFNRSIGLPLSAATREAWLHPNDNPAESYEQK